MRIALFPSAYRPSIGGVEELSRQLALAYVRKGHQVTVYTNRWPRSLPAHEVLDGVDVYRLPFRLPHASWRGRVSYPITNRLVSWTLHRLLKQQRADMIHVECVSSNTFYALRASDELSLPLVVTAQGELTMDPQRAFESGGTLPSLLRHAASSADGFTACSGKTLDDVETFVGHKIDGAKVIFNGTDVPTFTTARPLDLGSYVFAIGRLVPQKGFDVLLQAWSKIEHHGHHLVIAGSGPSEDDLRRLVDELGVTDSVRFFGPADRDTVPRLFAGATAVAIPSRVDEGLPLVSIETMAAGKPFVATISGGIREAVTDGVEGLLIEREDPEALADGLRRLLEGPELRARLAAAGAARARAFDWSLLADEYLSYFHDTARRRT
ncbi:MAG: glycosyltransferase family 4 protein [Acidimicrobiia bacterium]